MEKVNVKALEKLNPKATVTVAMLNELFGVKSKFGKTATSDKPKKEEQ